MILNSCWVCFGCHLGFQMGLQGRLRPWGPLGASWEVPWCLLGASWWLLGAFWMPLGRSWGALGALLGGLGAVWGHRSLFGRFLVRFLLQLGSKKAPQKRPKWSPKPIKIEDKFRHRKRTSSRPSWGRLGAILGHFRSPLGSQILIFQLFFHAFRENCFQTISLQEPSWTELGPTWIDFGTQNGAKMAPKSDPKTIKTHVNF